jgi:hypothetical protein
MSILSIFIEKMGEIISAILMLMSFNQSIISQPMVSQQIVSQPIKTQEVVETIPVEIKPQVITQPEKNLVQAYEIGQKMGELKEQIKQLEKVTPEIPKEIKPIEKTEVITPIVEIPIIQKPIIEPTVEPIIESQKTMKTITIISPYSDKGLGREYIASPEVKDESNYIELGLLVKEGEKFIRDAIVEVTATDSTQNKTFDGTGSMTKIYIEGSKKFVPYYNFHYEFKTSGKHEITFECDGKKESVKVQVK